MVDLKLKRVTIRNWMKIRHVSLDFPEHGLVLVHGVNTASGGALLSVGSGKTGVGEAISRALLGVQGRFATLKQFSTDKKGDTYVNLETTLHGKPLVVEYGYKCEELSQTGEALRYHYDGKDVERGRIEQTRADLSKLIGVSPLLASWTAFIDGDSIKFNKMSQADSVALVMASLRQPPWNEYHEASSKSLGKFKRSMAVAETTHATATSRVNTVEEAIRTAAEQVQREKDSYDQAVADNEAEIKKYKKAAEKKRAFITEAKQERAQIAKKLKLLEKQRAAENHKLEMELHAIDDKLKEAEEAREPLGIARDEARAKTTAALTNHNNYSNLSAVCPTCKQPKGKIDPKHLQQLKTAYEQAKKVSQAADTAWAAAEQRVTTLSNEYRAITKKQKEASAVSTVNTLSDRDEELAINIDTATDNASEYEAEAAALKAGPSDSALKVAQSKLADKKTELKEAQAELDKAAEAVAADKATLKVLEYWNMAFSPYGIPNTVLRDAIAPLNKEARRISATMTGGTIDVRYSTTRELASGLEKAQLNIEVDNKLGDKDLTGSSKGEAGLTNFIISETLSEVGQVSRRVGFRWYDEVVPHQDPKVCHNIYSYMSDIAHQLGILVFLVDHNPVAANYADHVLLVEKQESNGEVVSTVRWR